LYNIVKTSTPPLEELKQRWSDILESAASKGGKGSSRSILEEWDQEVWNSKLPRALKVELTRYFVRDLTTLSRFADAFVVSGQSQSFLLLPLPLSRISSLDVADVVMVLIGTGTSPTGVLSILLAGEEGAIGPRDFEGGSFGGRVRSISGYWVPTSSIKSLFG
jgi:hypothetical protein